MMAPLPIRTLIAINNAWRLRSDFKYSIYPSDFPESRRAPNKIAHISNDDYMKSIDEAGGIIFCGATMSFASGYWAVNTLNPGWLGFHGCDMVYKEGGGTHFYGTGTADPLREDISLRSLEAKACRMFLFGLSRGTICVNTSAVPNSRMTLPAFPINQFPKTTLERLKLYHRSMKSNLRIDLLRFYEKQCAVEKSAPFDALKHDYWINKGEYDEIFVDNIDKSWLQSQEVINSFLTNIFKNI